MLARIARIAAPAAAAAAGWSFMAPVAPFSARAADAGASEDLFVAKAALRSDAFTPFEVVEVADITHDTKRLRFRLPSDNHELGLPVASCLVTRAEVNGTWRAAGCGARVPRRDGPQLMSRVPRRCAPVPRTPCRRDRRPPVHAHVAGAPEGLV